MERLFYADPYIKEFYANVKQCTPSQNEYQIILDRTAFFPESGGQSCDVGFIGDAEVLHVDEHAGQIVHYTKKSVSVGEKVFCSIDWKRRFHNMQNHTGEHIVSGVIFKKIGYNNVGFHLSDKEVTLDVNGELEKDNIRQIEYTANEIAVKNVPVVAWYPSAEELPFIHYRSKLDLVENVRIVSIGEYDSCACCAPHVSKTGEIGMIKLLDFVRYKGGTRIHMKCGFDALADYNEKYQNVRKISTLLSANQSQTAEAVKDILANVSDLKKEKSVLKKRYIEMRLTQPDCTGTNVCIVEEYLDINDLRQMVNTGMANCSGIFAVFSKIEDYEYLYVCGSQNKNALSFMNQMKSVLSGKGGGNDKMVQGTVYATESEIRHFFGGINV